MSHVLLTAQLDDKYTTLDLSRGEAWRVLRKSLSPTFTSGKLKSMLEPMSTVADMSVEYLGQYMQEKSNREISIKEVLQGKKHLVIFRHCTWYYIT